MTRLGRFVFIVTCAFDISAMASTPSLPNVTPAPGIDFTLPSTLPGAIVSVHAATPHHPTYETACFVGIAGEQNRVAVGPTRRTIWLDRQRLIHLVDVRLPTGALSSKFVVTDLQGTVLHEGTDQENSWGLRFSPDRRSVASMRTPETGPTLLEVHSIAETQATRFPMLDVQNRPKTKDFFLPTWSPDSRLLAVARWEAEATGRVYPRLAIYDHLSDSVRRIEDGLVPGKRDSGGTRPLVWTAEGLFAYSNEAILRCDPAGSGCTRFHTLAADRFIHSAVAIAGGKALLLLRDLAADPFENRAVEIHELDLNSGTAKRLVRTPPGVFLESLDWISAE